MGSPSFLTAGGWRVLLCASLINVLSLLLYLSVDGVMALPLPGNTWPWGLSQALMPLPPSPPS